jgi:hypothetical protein
MGRWEHRYLGRDRFPDPSTPIEIEQLFTLESDDWPVPRLGGRRCTGWLWLCTSCVRRWYSD